MIIDTDVFIWYFRANRAARDIIEAGHAISLSAVTYMELVQGMRNKQELSLFRQEMNNKNWQILTLTAEITSRAMTYIEEYALSYSMALADALIAATAVERGATLLSANTKHYRFLAELQLQQFVVE